MLVYAFSFIIGVGLIYEACFVRVWLFVVNQGALTALQHLDAAKFNRMQ